MSYNNSITLQLGTMSMAIRDIFKINRKTFFNPASWMDYDSLKYQNKTIWTVIKSIVYPPKAAREETFEEAVKRLGLNEADIASRIRSYHFYTFIFIFVGLVVFAYSFYLLFAFHTLLSCLAGLSFSALLFGQAFKFDFWALQMRQRKLGLTLTDWKQHFLGERR